MTRKNGIAHYIATTLFVAALGLTAVTNAGSKSMDLPPDGMQLKTSSLPGYAKAQASCTACHSAEYMQYQPPNASRTYWDTMVKRMKTVFKAPIDDADMPEIVDYLVKIYGAEQPK